MSTYFPKIKVTHLSVRGPMKGLIISCTVAFEANNSPTLMFTSSSWVPVSEQFESGSLCAKVGSLERVVFWFGGANAVPKFPVLFSNDWMKGGLSVESVPFSETFEVTWFEPHKKLGRIGTKQKQNKQKKKEKILIFKCILLSSANNNNNNNKVNDMQCIFKNDDHEHFAFRQSHNIISVKCCGGRRIQILQIIEKYNNTD